MFTFDTVIDTVQTAKKQAVATFVKSESLAQELNKFVDVQTQYTKEAVKASTDLAAKVSEEMVKFARDAASKNYMAEVEKFTKTWTDSYKKATATAK